MNERSAQYEFRRIEPTDAYLERCAQMLMEVFPHGTYSAESLRWQYRDNPAGTVVGHDAIAPDGTIAGHYVLQPLAARVDGAVERGLLSFNTATHPAHQGKGLFTALAERSYTAAASSGYGFVVGVANANSTPGFTRRLGFTLVCALQALVGLRLRTGESGSAQFERTWDDASAAWRAARPNARYRSVGDALYAATPTTGIRALLAHGPLFARRAAAELGLRPIDLWIGLEPGRQPAGIRVPDRFRPSPLNLIWLDLTTKARRLDPGAVRFRAADFDPY